MIRMLPAAIVILILAGTPAHAHHSHPNFFLDQKVSIEGDIEELRYANPHVVLKIRAADGSLYTAEWQGASWLEYNAHVTLTTFRVGDHVIVSGAPSRDSSVHALVDLKEVRRPRDGWTYLVNREGRPAVAPATKR